ASAVTLAKAGKIEPTHADLISLALAHCKKNEDKDLCPVSQEWREWILKLKQYASSVERTSGHLVHRVAISAGPWIVVFNDPANAFLDNAPIKAGAIVVFRIEDY